MFEAMGSGSSRPVSVLLAAVLAAVLVASYAGGAEGQPAPAVDSDSQGADYVAGELLVTYDSDLSPDAAASVPEEVDGEVSQTLDAVDALVVSFPEVKDASSGEVREDDLARKKRLLEEDPAVVSVDYNYLRSVFFVPDDPKFDEQYGLKNINAPAAWDTTLGDPKVRIAVVDTGIDVDHPDLQGKVVAQKSFVGSNTSASGDDNAGHGTAVAGVAAATTDNATGVAASCPDCSLMSAKVGNSLDRITVADEVQGINWAVNNGADVVNLSFGGPGDPDVERNAVNRAARKGVVVVAAAGNDNTSDRNYPAAYRRAISVVATDASDEKADFSSFGRTVDVAAPGVDIVTTDIAGSGGFERGDYSSIDGTSFSSPMVAGVAGLLDAQGRSVADVRKRLQTTAKDLGPDGKDTRYGHGLIDAAAAVKR